MPRRCSLLLNEAKGLMYINPKQIEWSIDVGGPFIVWTYYGYDRWLPTSYPSIEKALEGTRYNSNWVLTRPVSYEVTET
jgi:hypothetical protein